MIQITCYELYIGFMVKLQFGTLVSVLGLGQCTYKIFFNINLVPSRGDIFSDHLLWSIFQSSLHTMFGVHSGELRKFSVGLLGFSSELAKGNGLGESG